MEFGWEMHLNEGAFRQIESGRKWFEVRLFDEKRKKLRVGDVGKIYLRPEDKEFYFVRVLSLQDYKNFEEMFSDLGAYCFGWEEGDSAERAARDMGKYYSDDDVGRFGVLGIELEVVNGD